MKSWNAVAVCSITTLILALGCSPTPAPAAPSGGGACSNQPNMAAALDSLRGARGSLDRAEQDKGGWRVKAIEATNTAISETERGCAFADTH
jgi:hypothetical protein